MSLIMKIRYSIHDNISTVHDILLLNRSCLSCCHSIHTHSLTDSLKILKNRLTSSLLNHCLSDSPDHSIIQSLNHSITHSFTHTLTLSLCHVYQTLSLINLPHSAQSVRIKYRFCKTHCLSLKNRKTIGFWWLPTNKHFCRSFVNNCSDPIRLHIPVTHSFR